MDSVALQALFILELRATKIHHRGAEGTGLTEGDRTASVSERARDSIRACLTGLRPAR
jgi:hypothetical protein